jgi:hypothetical protein
MRSFDSLEDAIEWHAMNGEMGSVGQVLFMSRWIAVSENRPLQNNEIAISTDLQMPEEIPDLVGTEQSQILTFN